MALLQILAARLARVDKFIFHSLTPGMSKHFETAKLLVEKFPNGAAVSTILQDIVDMKFEWGVGDGN